MSIRKAGRKAGWKPEYQMPELSGQFRLFNDPLENLPHAEGIYLLSEKNKPLYARSTEDLRHGVELHRSPQAIAAVTDIFWRPRLDVFLVSYAVLPSTRLLRPVERKIIEERKPLFNVPRAA